MDKKIQLQQITNDDISFLTFTLTAPAQYSLLFHCVSNKDDLHETTPLGAEDILVDADNEGSDASARVLIR